MVSNQHLYCSCIEICLSIAALTWKSSDPRACKQALIFCLHEPQTTCRVSVGPAGHDCIAWDASMDFCGHELRVHEPWSRKTIVQLVQSRHSAAPEFPRKQLEPAHIPASRTVQLQCQKRRAQSCSQDVYGYGSKLKSRGCAGFSLWFHLPFHVGFFWSHCHIGQTRKTARPRLFARRNSRKVPGRFKQETRELLLPRSLDRSRWLSELKLQVAFGKVHRRFDTSHPSNWVARAARRRNAPFCGERPLALGGIVEMAEGESRASRSMVFLKTNSLGNSS